MYEWGIELLELWRSLSEGDGHDQTGCGKTPEAVEEFGFLQLISPVVDALEK